MTKNKNKNTYVAIASVSLIGLGAYFYFNKDKSDKMLDGLLNPENFSSFGPGANNGGSDELLASYIPGQEPGAEEQKESGSFNPFEKKNYSSKSRFLTDNRTGLVLDRFAAQSVSEEEAQRRYDMAQNNPFASVLQERSETPLSEQIATRKENQKKSSSSSSGGSSSSSNNYSSTSLGNNQSSSGVKRTGSKSVTVSTGNFGTSRSGNAITRKIVIG